MIPGTSTSTFTRLLSSVRLSRVDGEVKQEVWMDAEVSRLVHYFTIVVAVVVVVHWCT